MRWRRRRPELLLLLLLLLRLLGLLLKLPQPLHLLELLLQQPLPPRLVHLLALGSCRCRLRDKLCMLLWVLLPLEILRRWRRRLRDHLGLLLLLLLRLIQVLRRRRLLHILEVVLRLARLLYPGPPLWLWLPVVVVVPRALFCLRHLLRGLCRGRAKLLRLLSVLLRLLNRRCRPRGGCHE